MSENYEVMLDEEYWTFDDNDVLKSVMVIKDGKEVDTPVVWDDTGAYVQNGNEKIYVLENIE